MLEDLTQLLDRYADVVIQVGINLQPGQRLMVRRAPLESAPFVRALTRSAYQAGARFVEVLWEDEQVQLLRYRYAPRACAAEVPYGFIDAGNRNADELNPVIGLTDGTPGLFAGEDSAFINASAAAQGEAGRYFRDGAFRNAFPWCQVSAATPGWAAQVFPDVEPEKRMERLWDAIFCACRADVADPIGSWRHHLAHLARRCAWLNAKRFSALHFVAAGTDLRVGLAPDHLWESAHMQTPSGMPFLCNLPSEEVFSLPHRERVEGVVTSTMPLNYNGVILREFCLKFEAGRVVDAVANQGEGTLRDLLDTDEGSCRLGEVALVPHSSIMSRWDRLFYTTLYDENAASHVALGTGYRTSLRGGLEMSTEEFVAAGGNDSVKHVDFMIGSARMDVDGILADGRAEPVMRGGEWAFVE